MSIWTEPISIPPISIIIFFIGYFINKYLDAKAGRHLQDPVQKIDYITDELVEQAIKQGKKFEGLRKHFQSSPPLTPPISHTHLASDIDEVRVNMLELMQKVSLEQEIFKNELLESCPPEQHQKCSEHFASIDKQLTDHIDVIKNGS